jgi:selenide, water dikinase
MGPGALTQVLAALKLPTHPDLLIGLEVSDDAAVYKIHDQLAMVQTVDFFAPIVDDPYTFGAIAAANALSDIYAMGARPVLALAIAGFPADLPPTVIQAILQGGADKVAEAGAVIAGGHTVVDKEPKYGLCVTGYVHPDKVTAKAHAQPGDLLLLTKPLGTGLITTAAKQGKLTDPALCRGGGEYADAEPPGRRAGTDGHRPQRNRYHRVWVARPRGRDRAQ